MPGVFKEQEGGSQNGSKVSKGQNGRIGDGRGNRAPSYRGLMSDCEDFGFYFEIQGK